MLSPPVQFATVFCENHSVLSMMLGTGAKNAATLWVNDVSHHSLDFAETNYISDSSHPYLSTGQLGGNSYDNWKLRSDFNLRRWKNASSPQAWRCQAWIEWTFFRDTLIL